MKILWNKLVFCKLNVSNFFKFSNICLRNNGDLLTCKKDSLEIHGDVNDIFFHLFICMFLC